MAEKISNYQCPSCTGPLRFDGKTGRLQCDYCGSSFSVQEIEALYRDKDEAAAQAMEDSVSAEGDWTGGGTNWASEPGLRLYNCPSCGAELICDETTAATSCPYCGNPSIVPGQLSDMLKPDYVIPFKLSKEDAKAALKKYYIGKRLLPRAFSEENHIEELKGVYVPFWLFDGAADADMQFQGTRVSTMTHGDVITTTTDYYRIRRSGTVRFEKIPVDASSKMPDEHMDAIEPYDYGELKPFSTAYLPGYLADKYDVDAKTAEERARKRAEQSALSAMEATVTGYASVSTKSADLHYRRTGLHYALLPVWLLSTRWNDKVYLFSVNGQTGKLVGDLPISRGRLCAWLFGIWAAVAAVVLLIQAAHIF